nr:hypothetical protein [Tanacetum cinerariifolium]
IDDDEDLPKKRKSSQQKLKRRYEKGEEKSEKERMARGEEYNNQEGINDDKQAPDADLPLWLALIYKFEKPASHIGSCKVDTFHNHDHEDHHDDDARLEGESSAKRQRTSEQSTFTRGESSSHAMEKLNPSDSGAQEHQEDFDPWSDNQGADDDEVPFEEVSQELLAELIGKGMNWMKSYVESQIVWESKKEDLSLQIPKKPALVFHSCERDPNAPPLVLVKKDLFYLKNRNSETRKCILPLHKIHACSFPKNNLEEMNTIWVRKIIKRFNLYARYIVEHWKIFRAKKAHIKRKLKQRYDPKEVYSEQRIIDVIRVQYDQGYVQEYMKEIVVKRADGEYKSFTESDYKYSHKDEIEDMYLIVHDYQLGLESYKVKVNLTTQNLIFPGIKEQKPHTITSLPFFTLIYENSKKETRIIDIDEIPKFYDATLKRILKNVKKINLDVKHDYADPTLNKDDVEYMVFYKINIEECLRYRDQMRH